MNGRRRQQHMTFRGWQHVQVARVVAPAANELID
jgi:hypothetical protein